MAPPRDGVRDGAGQRYISALRLLTAGGRLGESSTCGLERWAWPTSEASAPSIAARGMTSLECVHGRRLLKLNESLGEPSESHSESDRGTIDPRFGPARDEAGSSESGAGESGGSESSDENLPLCPSARADGSSVGEMLVAASAGASAGPSGGASRGALYAARARFDGLRRPAPCGAIEAGGLRSSSAPTPPASPPAPRLAPSAEPAEKAAPSPSESTS